MRVHAIPTLCVLAGLAVASCKDSGHQGLGMAEMQTPSRGPAPRDLGNREVWVTLQRDLASCSTAPRCGWTAHAVNEHDPGTHVDGIDLTRAGIAAGTPEAGVLDAPDGEVVIHGTRSPEGIFVATEVWRGLPGNAWSPGDVFVQVDRSGATACGGGPCGHESTRELNVGVDIAVPTVDFARSTDPGVDRAWIEDRVYQRGAVIAGRFIMNEQARGILEAGRERGVRTAAGPGRSMLGERRLVRARDRRRIPAQPGSLPRRGRVRDGSRGLSRQRAVVRARLRRADLALEAERLPGLRMRPLVSTAVNATR